MIDAFRAAFQELIDASLLGDPQRFGPAVGQVYGLASRVPASERQIALEALGPIFSGHHAGPGMEADLTVVAGALVEMGTAPGTTGIEVLRLLREAGKAAGVFLHAWEQTGGGPPPEPDQVSGADEERVATVLGDSAPTATMCWWTARRYGLSAKTMLSSARVRSAVRRDEEMHSDLLAIAAQLSAHLTEFGEVSALLRMDEVSDALVLDRTSRRGFRVRFEGIGDNFQLHTLLADALIGDQGRGLEGERPDPRWVAAFRDADPDPQAQVVHGWWNLVGADGTWVWNEGVPADIPLLEGERILVLEEQTYPRSWSAGRLYPLVSGSLQVVEELDSAEAQRWWSLIEPEEAPPEADPFPPPGAQSWWAPPAEPQERPFQPPQEESAPPPESQRAPQSPSEPAPPPLPEPPVEPEPRPAPVSTAATEIFSALTDEDLDAYDADPERGQAPPGPAPKSDEEDPDPPGSRLLPPLPPGVSDSSGWGPRWL